MNMIRIMKLNPEKFFRTVDQSMGQVLLHLADGSQYDLKQNCTIRQLLQSGVIFLRTRFRQNLRQRPLLHRLTV